MYDNAHSIHIPIPIQATYEGLMSQAREEHNKGPAPITNIPEYQVWEEHWIRCCKELNQVSKPNSFPLPIIEILKLN